MSNKQTIHLHLDATRRQALYQQLQSALTSHHQGKDSKDTPSLVFEALDALALVQAGIFVGLSRGVSKQTAKVAKRYFGEALDTYVRHLSQTRQEQPIIFN